jgi:hypothetical protein
VHLTRRPGVPGHMVVDSASEHLYISDTGERREKKWRQKKNGEYEHFGVIYCCKCHYIIIY